MYLRPLWEIRIQTIEWDNNGSLYTSTPTQEGNTTTLLEHHPSYGLTWTLWTNIVRAGLIIPFEYKKKDLPCADIIAFFTSFIDVQDIAWQTSPCSYKIPWERRLLYRILCYYLLNMLYEKNIRNNKTDIKILKKKKKKKKVNIYNWVVIGWM